MHAHCQALLTDLDSVVGEFTTLIVNSKRRRLPSLVAAMSVPLSAVESRRSMETTGSTEEFFDAEIEKRQQMVAKSRGFALQEHALSLYANCTKADCPHRTTKGGNLPPHR